jgi:hypothetical protein
VLGTGTHFFPGAQSAAFSQPHEAEPFVNRHTGPAGLPAHSSFFWQPQLWSYWHQGPPGLPLQLASSVHVAHCPLGAHFFPSPHCASFWQVLQAPFGWQTGIPSGQSTAETQGCLHVPTALP